MTGRRPGSWGLATLGLAAATLLLADRALATHLRTSGGGGGGANRAVRDFAARLRQPLRCAISSCAPFGDNCEKDENCVTDKCYDKKCGMGPTCRTKGTLCYQFGSHNCCTGECVPVLLKSDCFKMLGVRDSIHTHGGIQVDRQCETLGVCGGWPGTPPSTSLTRPWTVKAEETAAKYYSFKELTFDHSAIPILDDFVAMRAGQVHKSVAADTALPGSLRDAGVVIFDNESAVDTGVWSSYKEGVVTYCVAAVVKGSSGGNFYAVGRDCCDEQKGFYCGDVADASVKSGLVMAADTQRYAQASQSLIVQHGGLYLPPSAVEGGKDPPAVPLFVKMVKLWNQERLVPPLGYSYVPLAKVTNCVAPIWTGEKIDKPVQYFAAGTDCCSLEEGFHCGPVDAPDAHSGKVLEDLTGELRQAAVIATVKYGFQMATRPIFVSWTEEELVKIPAHGR